MKFLLILFSHYKIFPDTKIVKVIFKKIQVVYTRKKTVIFNKKTWINRKYFN